MTIKNKLNKITVALVAMFCIASCSIFQGKTTTSEYVDDAKITGKIKAEIVKDEMLSSSSISVETMKGVVQLSGFVSNKAQIKEASKIARNVHGVSKVENNLEVSGK